MGLSALVIAIAVVISFLVAAVIVVLVGYLVVTLVDGIRRGRAETPLRRLDADYQAARRAMNDAAQQSWRNVID